MTHATPRTPGTFILTPGHVILTSPLADGWLTSSMRKDGGVRLDHVSYAAGPEGLAAAVQRIGATLGAGLTDGGLHPGFGTRNFVLPLAGRTYLEVVATLDHPAVDKAPFGRAVARRAAAGGGWLAWVIAVEDITVIERRLGRSAAPGHRARPDGVDLRWRQIGVLDVMEDPQRPFFVAWETEPAYHPSTGASGEIRIERLEIAGDPDTVRAWLPDPQHEPVEVLEGVGVDWLSPEANEGVTGLVAVQFRTPRGLVRLE